MTTKLGIPSAQLDQLSRRLQLEDCDLASRLGVEIDLD